MTDKSQGSADSPDVSDVKDKSQDKVSHETYLRVLAEAKTAKERVKNLEAANQASADNKLKEQNEWKSLAESKEKEVEELKGKVNNFETTITNSIKINAFQRALGGKIKDDSYYQFVETDRIAINPDTNRVDDESVKLVVADFVKRHSALVEFKAAKMPNEAANGATFKGGKSVNEMSSKELEEELKKLGKI